MKNNSISGVITTTSSSSSPRKAPSSSATRQMSLTEQDLKNHSRQLQQQQQSELVSISMAEDVTMEDVARIMREEDAHLLESMHFEQSCSTGETPVLAGIDGNLDGMEDIMPLISYEVKVGEPLSGAKKACSPKSTLVERSFSLGDKDNRRGSNDTTGLERRFSHGEKLILRTVADDGGDDHDDHDENHVVYRQCLSGEIKSFRAKKATVSPTPTKALLPSIVAATTADHHEANDDDANDDDALPEGEETTTSSTCCSHDATVSAPSLLLPSGGGGVIAESTIPVVSLEDHKRLISSNDRRMNEAVQFVQAVGEMPPMDSNELCIIEEDFDDDTDDDDDGGDNATVIRLDEIGSQLGSVHDQSSVVNDTASYASMPRTSTKEHPPNDIPREIIKRKSRPQWPLRLPGWTFSHLDTSAHASFEDTVQDFVYKGIISSPPEIVSRGISRGNHVQLHRKAWLEVSDKYHRYGKNLRVYYRHWESMGYPTNMFFDWLDSKGEAAGQPLPNLDEVPRSKLDSDTVLYITNPEVSKGYALTIVTVDGKARLIDVDGELVRTGPDGWIFVLRDGVIYGAEKITSINGQSKQRFHHSSFFGGKAVAAAGIIITDDEGFLTRLYPHSGHYRPREAHMQRLLYFLYHQGVDLRSFDMDVQQIFHVSRETIDNVNMEKEKDKSDKKKEKASKKDKKVKDGTDKEEKGDNNTDNPKKEGEKKKKIDSLQLMPAVSVACYVAHKAHFIGQGIFSQIHQIRNARVTTVTEALELMNGKRKSVASNIGAD